MCYASMNIWNFLNAVEEQFKHFLSFLSVYFQIKSEKLAVTRIRSGQYCQQGAMLTEKINVHMILPLSSCLLCEILQCDSVEQASRIG